MDSRFPDKLFYRIGDVSEITGIKPHILRYWEAEFSVLHPRKNDAGQRVYERRDVELVIEIKKLLYEQRYTISGAKKFLARRHQASAEEAVASQSAWRYVGRAEDVPSRITWPAGSVGQERG